MYWTSSFHCTSGYLLPSLNHFNSPYQGWDCLPLGNTGLECTSVGNQAGEGKMNRWMLWAGSCNFRRELNRGFLEKLPTKSTKSKLEGVEGCSGICGETLLGRAVACAEAHVLHERCQSEPQDISLFPSLAWPKLCDTDRLRVTWERIWGTQIRAFQLFQN